MIFKRLMEIKEEQIFIERRKVILLEDILNEMKGGKRKNGK